MPGRFFSTLVSTLFALCFASAATASDRELRIVVHKLGIADDGSGQYLEIFENSKFLRSFWVSTGNPKKRVRPHGRRWEEIKGMDTPAGNFRVQLMKRRHTSAQSADGKSRPYWIFFNRGIAIHSTDSPQTLGKKSSLGCVKLAEEDAAWLYDRVKEEIDRNGPKVVRIEVLSARVPGTPPPGEPPFAIAKATKTSAVAGCCAKTQTDIFHANGFKDVKAALDSISK